jgi:hypothetical protein
MLRYEDTSLYAKLFNSFSKCEDTFAAGTLRTKLFNRSANVRTRLRHFFTANVWTRLRHFSRQTCGHVCGIFHGKRVDTFAANTFAACSIIN